MREQCVPGLPSPAEGLGTRLVYDVKEWRKCVCVCVHACVRVCVCVCAHSVGVQT